LPQINNQKCYAIIQREDVVDLSNADVAVAAPKAGLWTRFKNLFKKVVGSTLIDSTPILDPELENLLVILSKSPLLNEQKLTALRVRFIIHMGRDSTYRTKRALIGGLKWILEQLSHPLIDQDKVIALSVKIIEGAGNCTEGFHNRINQIILSLGKKDSLDGFLEQFRCDIVEKIARQHTDEVHALNHFFLKAAPTYAVPTINQDDPYVGAITDAVIRSALHHGFAEHYQFWGIFNSLYEQIRTGLINRTMYEGPKKTGYANSDYDEMITFLHHYLPATEIVPADWLLMDDDYIVFDLNWPTIMYKLWQKLSDEGYFIYSEPEQQLFNYLFNPEVSAETLDDFLFLTAQLSSNDLFTNDTQLKAFLNDGSWLPRDKKIVFFDHYIAKNLANITTERFLTLVPLFLQAGYAGPEIKIPIWAMNHLCRLLKAPNASGHNALAQTIYTQPLLAQKILELIEVLPSFDQMEIYGKERPIKKIDVYHPLQLRHSFIEAEISLLLIELKETIANYEYLENTEPGRYNELRDAISTMHGALEGHFNHYRKSAKNQQDMLDLQTHCMEAIQQSKQTILEEYPDIMTIAAQVLLFLTGIGGIYLLYQAHSNYYNNRSLFFPSATENKVNDMEDTLNILSTTPTLN